VNITYLANRHDVHIHSPLQFTEAMGRPAARGEGVPPRIFIHDTDIVDRG